MKITGNWIISFVLPASLICTSWSTGQNRPGVRQVTPTREEMNTDYKPDGEFDGVYIELVQRAWVKQKQIIKTPRLLVSSNYTVMIKEEPKFYRVHFVPKLGKETTVGGQTILGGSNSNGVEVMYIFDKKTLKLKFELGAG